MPWKNSYSWKSLEGELEINVACSTLGEVIFTVQLMSGIGTNEELLLKTSIETELGLLPQISKNAEKFFNDHIT